ncbi:hypothetical protein NUW54_g12467 [Trametes sanguinea]|uniref:Uncharacterized protein n=1 Tax=Trametes sanguinea TaxID=158606 RepID=A0ACC1MZC7_9APHY|nr:hypothetical protein NUW54_g12467 [Trametes sanguinea]
MTLVKKRSPSPLPHHLDDIKRLREWHQESDDYKRPLTISTVRAGPVPVPPNGHRGQEVVSYSPSTFVGRAVANEDLNDLILHTTQRLSRDGKRLTRAPQLLPNGIRFDWISDPAAERDTLKNLLSVTGISSADLDRVLSRVTARTSCASAVRKVESTPGLASSSRLTVLAPPTRHLLSGAHASNPIVIDDDEPLAAPADSSQAGDALRPSYVQISPAVTRRQSSSSGTSASFRLPNSVSQRPFATITPEEVGVGSSPGQTQWSSRTFGNARSMDSQDALNPEAILPFKPATDDRASVVSYASSPHSDGIQEIDREVTYGGHSASSSNSQNRPGEENVLHPRPLPRSVRNSVTMPSQRQLEKQRADYGNWQSLAGESSDAEMEDVRPSSRESSPDRAFPPQAQDGVAGLGFLPKTYDVSGLVLPPVFASGYLSEPCFG